MTHVVINDYLEHQRTDLFFTKEDFEEVDSYWNDEDQLLVDLQSNIYFKNRTRWCHLEPFHFRIMVTKICQQISGLSDADRTDEEHPTVKSLHFLLCGLIKSLEKRSDSAIEFLKVQRVGEYDVSVEFQSVMQMILPPMKEVHTAKGITVVVDNSQ